MLQKLNRHFGAHLLLCRCLMEGLGLACAIYYGIGSEGLSIATEDASTETKSFVIIARLTACKFRKSCNCILDGQLLG